MVAFGSCVPDCLLCTAYLMVVVALCTYISLTDWGGVCHFMFCGRRAGGEGRRLRQSDDDDDHNQAPKRMVGWLAAVWVVDVKCAPRESVTNVLLIRIESFYYKWIILLLLEGKVNVVQVNFI